VSPFADLSAMHKADLVVLDERGAFFDPERSAFGAAGRGIETQGAATIASGRGFDAGVVLLGRNRLDIEMLPDVLVLAGEGNRVRCPTAFQIAQVQITELIEANIFSASAQDATQLVERETATVADGALIRAVQARSRIL
jgi:hypothetical protein